jgi:hypothetical protein
MMRLIAYALFGIGIIAAIVGGAKLPAKQVEYLQQIRPFDVKLAAVEAELKTVDQVKSLEETKASLTKSRDELGGQVEFLKEINEFDVKIAAVDADLKSIDQLSAAEVKSLEETKASLTKSRDEIGGWPPEKKGERFSNAVPVFCVGVGIAIVGIVLWRNDIRDRRVTTQAEQAEGELPDTEARTTAADTAPGYIISVQQAIETLMSMMNKASHQELLDEVDKVLSEHVTPFVELRERLIEEMGLSRAAPIMLYMASGERLLNRAWSAEADGYRHESVDAIDEAAGSFREALQEMEGRNED